MMILLWGTLVVVCAVILPSHNVAVASGKPSYNYASPSPPPLSTYSNKWLSPLSYEHNLLHTTPLSHHDRRPMVKVAGMVYCYKCYNWKHPATSHHKKLLKDALVKVTCKVGYNDYVGYGKTKSNGKYIVTIEGYPYHKYGAEGCKVRLEAAPEGSMCNIPTGLNQGVVPKVYSKSNHVVLLKAKFLAFASRMSYKCESHPLSLAPSHYSLSPYYYKSPPLYYYNSPPPPSSSPPSPYYYTFSPPSSPSSPTPYYKSPPPPYHNKSPPPPSSPPPPPYYYKSPPSPYSFPPPIYHYNSPPPPSPSPKSPYHSPSPPPYHYNSPPPPSSSPPPYHYTSPPPPSPSPPPPYLYISPPPRNYLYSPPPPSRY